MTEIGEALEIRSAPWLTTLRGLRDLDGLSSLSRLDGVTIWENAALEQVDALHAMRNGWVQPDQ